MEAHIHPRLLTERGSSSITVLAIMSVIFFVGMQATLQRQLDSQKDTRRSEIYEGKKHLLFSLFETVAHDLTMRNSRFDINQRLQECLMASGATACDERELYDFVAFPPTPYIPFTGTWPVVPNGFTPVAGGVALNPIFYNRSGGVCDPTSIAAASNFCPLQGITQFRPMCGGTPDAPGFTATGPQVCAGPATGFEITVGVASTFNGLRNYTPDDRKVFRISSHLLRN